MTMTLNELQDIKETIRGRFNCKVENSIVNNDNCVIGEIADSGDVTLNYNPQPNPTVFKASDLMLNGQPGSKWQDFLSTIKILCSTEEQRINYLNGLKKELFEYFCDSVYGLSASIKQDNNNMWLIHVSIDYNEKGLKELGFSHKRTKNIYTDWKSGPKDTETIKNLAKEAEKAASQFLQSRIH